MTNGKDVTTWKNSMKRERGMLGIFIWLKHFLARLLYNFRAGYNIFEINDGIFSALLRGLFPSGELCEMWNECNAILCIKTAKNLYFCSYLPPRTFPTFPFSFSVIIYSFALSYIYTMKCEMELQQIISHHSFYLHCWNVLCSLSIISNNTQVTRKTEF